VEIATAASSLHKPSRRLPGLDLVRGVAILMVLLDHGLAIDQGVYERSGSRPLIALGHILRLGHLGVHLFFILSGLLITGILLDHRNDPDYFRNFYARRALRILPAYLLMLAILLTTHSVTARYVGVCLLFLANMTGLFGMGSQYGALWSLSVEEQFYLVWPLTVRRLSPRGLALACIGIVLLTPVLRFGLLYGPHLVQDIRFKTWAVGDFFAVGALLAIAWRLPNRRSKLQPFTVPLMAVGALMVSLQHALAKGAGGRMANVLHAIYLDPWLLLLTGFTLFSLLHPGIAEPFIARPFLFLGQISYGLYLCHPFVFALVNRHWPPNPPSTVGHIPSLLLHFLVGAGLSIAIAALSRFTLEEFFLRLKPKHEASTTSLETAQEIT
jgi:peptidoglycan/LPS O-acetylase OafA/YrhL